MAGLALPCLQHSLASGREELDEIFSMFSTQPKHVRLHGMILNFFVSFLFCFKTKAHVRGVYKMLAGDNGEKLQWDLAKRYQ